MRKLYLSLIITLAAYNVSFAQCTPNFQASKNPICVGEEVYFSNLTTGDILTYAWTFGAGASVPPNGLLVENPGNITYSSAGTKTITLTVTCTGVDPTLCTAASVVIPGVTILVQTCVPILGGGVLITTTRTQYITVKDVPTPTFTSNGPACTGDDVDFTYTGSADVANTFSWSFGAGASPSSSNVESPTGVVYGTDGTKNVTLTVSNGACEGSTASPVTITPGPTAGIVSSAPACVDEDVAFASAGNGDSWLWDFGTDGSAVAPSTTTSENPTATYTSSGGKIVTLSTSLTGCTNSANATTTIMINETPVSSFTSATTPACTDEAIDFTYTGGNTGGGWRYAWDFGPGASPATSSAENPAGIVYSTHGTKTVTLTVFDNNCSATSTTDITINFTPTANFTHTAPACTDDSVYFYNSGTLTGVTWAWDFGSGAAPATLTTQNGGVVYATAGGKEVTLITTTGTCADTAKEIITIFQSPTITFDGPASVCVNATFNVNNTGSSGGNLVYNWDFGSGAIPQMSSATQPKGIYYTTAGDKTITLNASNLHCSTTSTVTVTALETPVSGFASTEPQCTDLPVDFINMGSSNAGAGYEWDFGVDATTATATTEDAPGILYSSPGNKVVTQIVTTTATSCADTAIQSITIHQTPTATFTADDPKCANEAVTFTNTGSTGSTGVTNGEWGYLWDFGSDALPQTSTAENPDEITYTTGGTKTVTFTVYNGYCTETNTQTITINDAPVANAGRDTTICANTSTLIGSASVGSNTYSWFAPVTLSSATAANPVATPVAHITEYIVTVTDANTCTSKDTIVVTMLDPIEAYAGVDEEICRFDSVQVGVGLVEQQLYSWSPAAGLSSTTSPNPMASPDSTTTYQVTVTFDGKACIAETDDVTITVHQLPYIEAGTVNKQPSPNDSITIVDSITIGDEIQLIAIGGLQYVWEPPYRLDNVGIFNPYATPDSTTSYIVTGTDIYGCIETDTVTIIVLTPSFWVPTGFTPDGNGENDVFYVRGEGITDFELGIFNRWGEQIYLSNSLDEGWDGTRPITNQELPAGAYIYYIKGTLTDGTPVDAKGLINLIR